jgi:beta-ribofuranosylaminobenzene 5'-phosphate synthase
MIEVRTPGRLHFGLLAYHPQARRQFGGVGLMVRRPDVLIRLEPRPVGDDFEASGRMADRAVEFARHFARRAVDEQLVAHMPGAHLHVLRVPRPHAGLGSGTQLAMAVARALAALIELDATDAAELAHLVDRGRRSAIGAHGSLAGGLIVDGGKAHQQRLAPLVGRFAFPDSWTVLLVRPSSLHGTSGTREVEAFADLPPIEPGMTDRMCRIVLLDLLPSLVDRNLESFGEALFELQQLAGECFKAAQGGVYADPLLAEIVGHIRKEGVHGVGQSSWGPTLYAVCDDLERADHLAANLQRRFELTAAEIMTTRADNEGGTLRHISPRVKTGGG